MVWEYLIRQYRFIPTILFIAFFVLACIGAVFFILKNGTKSGIRKTLGLILIEYIALLFCSTVIFRNPYHNNCGHNFLPLWSYLEILNGNKELVIVNVMNIIVFVPIGMLLTSSLKNISCRNALLAGFCVSISIESFQCLLDSGFVELDDVLHNTFGSLLGYLLVKISRSVKTSENIRLII